MPFFDALRQPIAAFHRHPAMSSSNPFRRKETQVLGLDNSSFVSSTADIASAVARKSDPELGRRCRCLRCSCSVNPAAASIKGKPTRTSTTRPQSPRMGTYHGDDSNSDSYHSSAAKPEERNTFPRSQFDHHSPVQNETPFPEDFEEDDDDSGDDFDEDIFPPKRKGRRLVPYKANQALNVDWDNPWRNSTAMGNLPGTGKHAERDSTAIPAKALRTLGMSRPGQSLDQESYRRENSLSPQTDNVAPKALRTLGIPSNPFRRPQTGDTDSQHGDDGDRFSIASAAHRQMDADEFKRLLHSGHRAAPFDNSSSTDISSNSRSSILSNPSYRETPRSSHEILPEDLVGSRGYNRLAHRTPLSLVSSTKSRTDSLVNPNAVLTEPFSPLSSLHPDSPTDLNKPLPHAPKRPDTIFELPAHIPGSHFGPSDKTFIAELPASEPIAELPSDTVGVVELPNNEIVESPMSASTNVSRTPQGAHFRRTGLTRAATADYPNIAELESPQIAELPTNSLRTQPLHHAKTIPALHTASHGGSQHPPIRGSSLPKKAISIGGMPPDSTLPRSSQKEYMPVLSTILPHYTRPISPPQPKTSDQSTSSSQQPHSTKRPAEGNTLPASKGGENPRRIPATTSEQGVKEETSAEPTLSPANKAPASPSFPSNLHSAGLGSIAQAVPGSSVRTKISTASLRGLDSPITMAEARRKGSSTSLGDVKNDGKVIMDISSLQKDVDSLRHKIGLPDQQPVSSTAATGQGTPPDAVETGQLAPEPEKARQQEDESKLNQDIETSEIQQAVQSAADEAAGGQSEITSDAVSGASNLEELSSGSSDDITPRASNIEGIRNMPS